MKVHRFRRAAIMALGSSLLLAQLAFGQSASELLEKGIYTEETKGDLQAAILLYEKVIEQGKDAETTSAQALYRLALVHLKLSNSEKATALLEQLIQEHPEQEELVEAAKRKLPGRFELGPIPWSDGEQMILNFRFPAGMQVGMSAYHATMSTHEGRPAWVVGNRVFAGVNSASAVFADPQTFRPLHSKWKHTLIGEAIADYDEKSVTIKNVTSDTVKTIDLVKPVYDNEQIIHMLRRLPLAAGYKTTIDLITTLGGGTILPLGIEVTKEEEITTPAGTFKCAKVEMSVKQDFWFSMDEKRYLVKMDAGGVIGELVEVRHSGASSLTVYKDATLGFSIAAPHGWFFYNGGSGDEKNRSRLAILDPEANAQSMLFVYPLETISAERKSSLKAFAESRIKEAREEATDYKMRGDFADRELNGFPTLSWVAEGTDPQLKAKKINYNLVTFTEKLAVHFFYLVHPEKHEMFRHEFDPIVGSFLAR